MDSCNNRRGNRYIPSKYIRERYTSGMGTSRYPHNSNAWCTNTVCEPRGYHNYNFGKLNTRADLPSKLYGVF